MTHSTKRKTAARIHKGSNLIDFASEYCVIDLETTDFDYFYGEIIEIAALKFREDRCVDSFHKLIKPTSKIPQHIETLTGISNDLVVNAPSLLDVLPHFLNFIQQDILIAHNANFDINFLYDASLALLNKPLENDFIDTLRLSRALVKHIENHRLETLARYFSLPTQTHRAMEDVEITQRVYLNLKEIAKITPISKRVTPKQAPDLSLITSTVDIGAIDTENYFYSKNIVFTGKMDTLTKREAAQLAANLGAIIQTNVTSNTDVLVLGNLQYQHEKFGDKSSKHKKAERMIREGYGLQIMTEITFLEIMRLF